MTSRLADKAAARRKRLRAKVETRQAAGRIECSVLREDRVNHAFLRIGKISLKTEKKPRLTTRGVNIARRPVRVTIEDVRASTSTRTP